MSKNKLLKNVPGDELQDAINFNLRHSNGKDAHDYLMNFLVVARQYGFATQDDSWGELEKELAIVFRNLEQSRRFIDSSIHAIILAGDEREYDEIYDDLMERGESFWRDIQDMKKKLKKD